MKTKTRNLKALLTLAAFAGALSLFGAGSSAQAAANLIQNGDFAANDGSFDFWTVSGDQSYTQINTSVPGVGTSPPGAGLYLLSVGATDPANPFTLSQSFTDIAGHPYIASALIAASGDSPSAFTLSVGSNAIALLDPHTGIDPVTGTPAWTPIFFSFIGTGNDTLTLTGSDEPWYFGVADISVTAPGPVPGTGVAGLAAFALAGLYARMRRA